MRIRHQNIYFHFIKYPRLDVLRAPDRLLQPVRARDEIPLRLRGEAPPQRPLPLQLPDVVPDPDRGLGGGAGHHVEEDDLKGIDGGGGHEN